MLLDKFFNIKEITKDESNNKFNVVIELNPQHPIYEGHFPDNPVVPGVCMQQMVKETLSFILKKDITLSKGDIIKFLNFIIPTANKKYSLQIHIKSNEANQIKTDSIISDEDTIYFKYTAYFKIAV